MVKIINEKCWKCGIHIFEHENKWYDVETAILHNLECRKELIPIEDLDVGENGVLVELGQSKLEFEIPNKKIEENHIERRIRETDYDRGYIGKKNLPIKEKLRYEQEDIFKGPFDY